MTAEIIVPLNVDGTVLQTSSLTMLKYPNLVKIGEVVHTRNKKAYLSRKFFFDDDAEYFRIVLNFLRNGEVFTCDEEIFFGVQNLAENLKLVKFLERQHGFFQQWYVLDIGREKEIKMTRNFLTRVPKLHLAKFFYGEQGSENPYLYVQDWPKKLLHRS